MAELKEGDIVQLDPNQTSHAAFNGCFLVISEIYDWGVQGYIQNIGVTLDEMGGQIYYRANHGTYQKVGKAVWVIPC